MQNRTKMLIANFINYFKHAEKKIYNFLNSLCARCTTKTLKVVFFNDYNFFNMFATMEKRVKGFECMTQFHETEGLSHIRIDETYFMILCIRNRKIFLHLQ